jgi:hypothetical protein
MDDVSFTIDAGQYVSADRAAAEVDAASLVGAWH